MRIFGVLFISSLYFLCFAQPVSATQEVFFGCQQGFQYESKKDAARCIKQQKLSFRPPIACSNNKSGKAIYRLAVDKVGIKDQCILDDKKALNSIKLNAVREPKSSFSPLCKTGYKLKELRGKDACGRRNPEIIEPPSKKVSR